MNLFFRLEQTQKICGTEGIHIKPLKVTNWARKSIHHDVLLCDKEIPPSDPNNLVMGRASFLTNHSGPRVGFPCPTTIHMKDTLIP